MKQFFSLNLVLVVRWKGIPKKKVYHDIKFDIDMIEQISHRLQRLLNKERDVIANVFTRKVYESTK